MLLRLFLALPLMFLPNALHLSGQPLVAGLNLTNLLFLVVLLAVPLLTPAGAPRLRSTGRLTVPLLATFAVYVLAFAIAQFRSPGDMMVDLQILKTALFYPLFYFIYRNCGLDLKATRQLIALSLIVAIVAALEALGEAIDYNVISHYSDRSRASGPFGIDYRTANLAGYFYAAFLPVFVALALFLRGRPGLRMAALIATGLVGLAILATFSRQAYAVALLCLLLVAIRRSIAAAILVAALMIAATTVLPQSVSERVESTTQTNVDGTAELDTSTASRFDIWTGAFEMWREHPAGVGLNRFKDHIGDYSIYEGFDAHNHFVLILAEAGPLGLLALLWLLWRAWGIGVSLVRNAPPADAEAMGLGTGFGLMVIAISLGNSFGSFFLHGLAMGSIWAFFGLVERYATLKAESVPPAAAPRARAFGPRPDIASKFPLAARATGHRGLRDMGDVQ